MQVLGSRTVIQTITKSITRFKNRYISWLLLTRIILIIIVLIICRYFPVANLTRTRQAVIIEPLRPEKFFVKTFNATSLYILSICEVCGSYQCPYCPFYSSSLHLSPNPVTCLFTIIISVIFSRTQ